MNEIKRIIEAHGGMAALEKQYISIENEPYMRLGIEHIGQDDAGRDLVAVAHWGKQNGDAMRDPEVVFVIMPGGPWRPISFRNDYMGTFHEAAPGRYLPSVAVFCRAWNKNLRAQGFLAAYLHARKGAA